MTLASDGSERAARAQEAVSRVLSDTAETMAAMAVLGDRIGQFVCRKATRPSSSDPTPS
jgi:hypothetical protein